MLLASLMGMPLDWPPTVMFLLVGIPVPLLLLLLLLGARRCGREVGLGVVVAAAAGAWGGGKSLGEHALLVAILLMTGWQVVVVVVLLWVDEHVAEGALTGRIQPCHSFDRRLQQRHLIIIPVGFAA
jgi:hypothetical protein